MKPMVESMSSPCHSLELDNFVTCQSAAVCEYGGHKKYMLVVRAVSGGQHGGSYPDRGLSCARLDHGPRHTRRPFPIGPIVGKPPERLFKPTDGDIGSILKRLELFPIIKSPRADRRKRDSFERSVCASDGEKLFDA